MMLALVIAGTLAAAPDGGLTPIECPEPQVHLKKALYLDLKSSSRPLAQLKKGDEAVVELSGANGSPEMVDVLLRFEPDANLELLGPTTATFRHVPYATQDKDLIRAKVRVRLKGEGGRLRVYYAVEPKAAATHLATTVGFGTQAEGAPRPDHGTFAELIARALEPCVKESRHCFAVFDGLRLTVSLTFASSGAAKTVAVNGVAEPIASCFKERLMRVTVPPFEGEPFEVTIPLIMSDQPQALLQAE